jgi:hypothetical protein
LARDRYRRSLAIAQPSTPRTVSMLGGATDTQVVVSTAPKRLLPMAYLPGLEVGRLLFLTDQGHIGFLAHIVKH